MSRTFAYVRVSTTGQTTENQIQEIEAAGFKVDPRRVVSETVSGSSAIEQRPGFIKLLNKLEQEDVLIACTSSLSATPAARSRAFQACSLLVTLAFRPGGRAGRGAGPPVTAPAAASMARSRRLAPGH